MTAGSSTRSPTGVDGAAGHRRVGQDKGPSGARVFRRQRNRRRRLRERPRRPADGPTYAVPRLLERNGLTLQDFDFTRSRAFASVVLATPVGLGVGDLLQRASGSGQGTRLHRPRQAERQRLLAGRGSPVRRDRWAHRRPGGQADRRKRRRACADLDLCRRAARASPPSSRVILRPGIKVAPINLPGRGSGS